MFGSSKSAASLTSGLLARKGQARPAMRPGYVGLTPAAEDLGWNDMGEDHSAYQAQAVPQPMPGPQPVPAPQVGTTLQPVPPVLREREVLETQIARPAPAPIPEEAPVPVSAPAPVSVQVARPALPPLAVEQIARALGDKPKAAFTLRLDKDRHLRLRLASAVANRSAQQLVTEALDALLNNMPEIEALAGQLPKRRKK
jgi:hypothetical protein